MAAATGPWRSVSAVIGPPHQHRPRRRQPRSQPRSQPGRRPGGRPTIDPHRVQQRPVAGQPLPDRIDRHRPRHHPSRRRGHGRGPRGLAHRHARRHRPGRRVRVVRRREAPSHHQQSLHSQREQGPVRDPVHAPLAHVPPFRVAPGAVILDRRAAQGDLVLEPAARQHVVAGEPVVAVDAPALPDPDRRAGRHDHAACKAGHPVTQEPVVLADLASALDLRRGQLLRVRGIHAGDAGHVDERDPRVRGAVPRPLDARQPVAARRRRLAHQPPQLPLRDGRRRVDVHVRHLEQRRERLDRATIAWRIVGHAGHRAHIGVTRRIDDDAGPHPARAALVPETDRGRASIVDLHARHLRVQEQIHPGVLGQALPEHLEDLGIVGHAGAGAVRVRSLEGDPIGRQPARDLPAEPADHASGLIARRVERIERVENRGRGAAHEREAIHEQDGRAETRRADGGGRPCRARAHDDDVVPVIHARAPGSPPAPSAGIA